MDLQKYNNSSEILGAENIYGYYKYNQEIKKLNGKNIMNEKSLVNELIVFRKIFGNDRNLFIKLKSNPEKLPIIREYLKKIKIPKLYKFCRKKYDATLEYTISKKIGEGSFGKVYIGLAKSVIAKRRCGKNKIAVKILEKHTSKNYINRDNTIEALKEICALFIANENNNPNIINLYDAIIDKKYIYIIMELAEKNNLLHFMHPNYSNLIDNKVNTYKSISGDINICKEVVKQICHAFVDLHKSNIVHSDLKPENIYITRDPFDINDKKKGSSSTIKIGDFGLSSFYPNSNKPGTPVYMAPELFNERITERNTNIDEESVYVIMDAMKKVDIWAIGIITFELITGKNPIFFSVRNNKLYYHPPKDISELQYNSQQWSDDLLTNILSTEEFKKYFSYNNKYKEIGNCKSLIPAEFIYSCLRKNPSDRLDIDKLYSFLFSEDKVDLNNTLNKPLNNYKIDLDLGKSLYSKGKLIDTSKIINNNNIIALYFSAHWCPPCRNFTPRLVEIYKKYLKNAGVEIVFVSWDKNEEEFNQYYDIMPWLAIPHGCVNTKKTINSKYNINSIPSLIFLHADTGEVIVKNGVKSIYDDPACKKIIASDNKNHKIKKKKYKKSSSRSKIKFKIIKKKTKSVKK